jgi:hypothetical protein
MPLARSDEVLLSALILAADLQARHGTFDFFGLYQMGVQYLSFSVLQAEGMIAPFGPLDRWKVTPEGFETLVRFGL